MEKTMGYLGTVKTTMMAMVVVLFFVQGLFAQAPAAAKPASGAKPVQKREDLVPLMKKLPPLPPRKPVKKLPPEGVVVRVNGVDITMGMINRQADMMVALLKNKAKNIPPERLKMFRSKNFKRFSDDLFMRTMIDTCLASSNIVISESMKLKVEKSFARSYGAKGQTIEQVKEVAAKAGYLKELEAQLESDARFKTFITTVHSNRYYVTDAQVQKYKKGVQDYNARANATNEYFLATAKKMAEQVKKNPADFAKLADQFSQDAEKKPGGYLGECEESDFTDEPHLWRAISKLKVGEVTEVLETETGYCIYKV